MTSYVSELRFGVYFDIARRLTTFAFHTVRPQRYKTFVLCSTQLSMKFVLLTNLKVLQIANFSLLNIAEQENFSANKYENFY